MEKNRQRYGKQYGVVLTPSFSKDGKRWKWTKIWCGFDSIYNLWFQKMEMD